MGSILASAIIASARVTLLDQAADTWSDAELLLWLNEAQRAVCGARPDQHTKREPMNLVVGTLQQAPAGATVVLRLDENVVSGRRTRLCDAGLMDVAQRFWPNATKEPDVQDYFVDPRDDTRFHVLPPNDGTGQIVVFYACTPPPLALTDPIVIDDTLEAPLKDYLLGLAYSANTKRQDLSKATFYQARYEKALGMNAQSNAAMKPKYANVPGGA